jgi:hypothetical protein
MLHAQAIDAIAEVSGERIESGLTWGHQDDGSARRWVAVPGVEHIGVLYSGVALEETLAWVDASLGRAGRGDIDRRGASLGLLYLSLLALAWPLSKALPRVAERPLGAGLSWRLLWPVAVTPAVLTPLILWPLPTDILPIMLADYLALHFAVYGILTALVVWLSRRPGTGSGPVPIRIGAFGIATVATVAYACLAFGLPTDRFLAAVMPGAERVPTLLFVLGGTLLYALADEWATRGPAAASGGYWLTKLLFLLSLLGAVALNLNALFFLVIIVPAILVLFVLYGLLSDWVYRQTRYPFVSAIANAIVLALVMSVTFPVVGA